MLRTVFRFSLRTLLVFVTLACIWLGLRTNAASRQKTAAEKVLRYGGGVAYGWELHDGNYSRNPTATPPVPNWIRRQLGDDFLFRIRSVHLDGVDMDAEKLACFLQLPKLLWINVSRTGISDDSLKLLLQNHNPRVLGLMHTRVTATGIQHLRNCHKLEFLSLNGNPQINDDAIPVLKSLTHLRQLDLTGTSVSKQGTIEIQTALPKCRVQAPL